MLNYDDMDYTAAHYENLTPVDAPEFTIDSLICGRTDDQDWQVEEADSDEIERIERVIRESTQFI